MRPLFNGRLSSASGTGCEQLVSREFVHGNSHSGSPLFKSWAASPGSFSIRICHAPASLHKIGESIAGRIAAVFPNQMPRFDMICHERSSRRTAGADDHQVVHDQRRSREAVAWHNGAALGRNVVRWPPRLPAFGIEAIQQPARSKSVDRIARNRRCCARTVAAPPS